MRILIATHHLLGYSGSELYTIWLATSVKQAGHDVYVYSPYIDKLAPTLTEAKIPYADDIRAFADVHFDLAHVHHNIIALEVRVQFPELPIVMQIHGIKPLLEQLPQENIYPARLLCVSEGVRSHLISRGIHPGFLDVVRNGIELDWWQSDHLPSEKPKHALLLSAKIRDEQVAIIETTCASLGIALKKIGGRFGQKTPEQVKSAMHASDFVITIGRGAMEAMAARRPVLVYDCAGGDGFVTPENFRVLMETSFNGTIFRTMYTAQSLEYTIREHYNPQDVERNRLLLAEYFASEKVLRDLLDLYGVVKAEVVPVMPFEKRECIKRTVEIVRETRSYSRFAAQQQLDDFRAGKVYRFWRAWHRLVDFIGKR